VTQADVDAGAINDSAVGYRHTSDRRSVRNARAVHDPLLAQ
jgi:hypothetical protein